MVILADWKNWKKSLTIWDLQFCSHIWVWCQILPS